MDQTANPRDIHFHVCEPHGLLRTEMPEKRRRIDVGPVGDVGHCHLVETSLDEQVQCRTGEHRTCPLHLSAAAPGRLLACGLVHTHSPPPLGAIRTLATDTCEPSPSICK